MRSFRDTDIYTGHPPADDRLLCSEVVQRRQGWRRNGSVCLLVEDVAVRTGTSRYRVCCCEGEWRTRKAEPDCLLFYSGEAHRTSNMKNNETLKDCGIAAKRQKCALIHLLTYRRGYWYSVYVIPIYMFFIYIYICWQTENHLIFLRRVGVVFSGNDSVIGVKMQILCFYLYVLFVIFWFDVFYWVELSVGMNVKCYQQCLSVSAIIFVACVKE